MYPIYLFNITIFSATFTNHLEYLKSVFLEMQRPGPKLKPSNYSFFHGHLEFMVHKVSATGIFLMDDKVEAINQMSSQ